MSALSSAAVPRRPLGIAEVLDGAVRIVRRNPRAAFGFALPVAVVQAGLGALVLLQTDSSSGLSAFSSLLRGVLALGAGTVLSGLLAPVVMSDALGTPIPSAEAWRRLRGLKGLLLLVVLGVGVSLAEFAGLFFALVGGIWLWGVWAVAAPAMAIETLGPIAAVKRSFELTRNSFWRTWGVRALGWLLTEILALLITAPLSALAAYIGHVTFGQDTGTITHPTLFVTLTALAQLLAVALVAPITAAVDGLIYVDLRMRVEGLDLVTNTGSSP